MRETEQEKEEKPSVRSYVSYPTKNDRKRTTYIVLIAAALLLIGGGLFVSGRLGGSPEEPAPTITPIATAEPTPEPELRREDLRLQILNGGGVAGAASKAQQHLEGLGYNVADVGNASSFDFTETEIRIKDSKREYLQLLRDDLSEEYTLASGAETLGEDSDYDVVVVIGDEKAGQTPTPSPTATPTPTPTATATPTASPSATSE